MGFVCAFENLVIVYTDSRGRLYLQQTTVIFCEDYSYIADKMTMGLTKNNIQTRRGGYYPSVDTTNI